MTPMGMMRSALSAASWIQSRSDSAVVPIKRLEPALTAPFPIWVLKKGIPRRRRNCDNGSASCGAARGRAQHHQRALCRCDHVGGAIDRYLRRRRWFDDVRRGNGDSDNFVFNFANVGASDCDELSCLYGCYNIKIFYFFKWTHMTRSR
jgi:hypothetical protein